MRQSGGIPRQVGINLPQNATQPCYIQQTQQNIILTNIGSNNRVRWQNAVGRAPVSARVSF